MDRLDALETVKDQVTALYDFLQTNPVDVAIDGEDADAIVDLATACEPALEWVTAQIKKENDRLAEENPRNMYDETGHTRGDF